MLLVPDGRDVSPNGEALQGCPTDCPGSWKQSLALGTDARVGDHICAMLPGLAVPVVDRWWCQKTASLSLAVLQKPAITTAVIADGVLCPWNSSPAGLCQRCHETMHRDQSEAQDVLTCSTKRLLVRCILAFRPHQPSPFPRGGGLLTHSWNRAWRLPGDSSRLPSSLPAWSLSSFCRSRHSIWDNGVDSSPLTSPVREVRGAAERDSAQVIHRR